MEKESRNGRRGEFAGAAEVSLRNRRPSDGTISRIRPATSTP